jgi:hypothetical protein
MRTFLEYCLLPLETLLFLKKKALTFPASARIGDVVRKHALFLLGKHVGRKRMRNDEGI